MGRPYSTDTLDQRTANIIIGLQKQVNDLQKKQLGWQGYLPLPVRASDPAVTKTGQYGLYYNSGTGKVRKSYNGGAWADTTI